ncbi:hypothetical protein LIA77_07781 [Sarocladium implicatum]|nr:hypothetical protein LIA77_07781 [Sarocladium implicatum]
MSSAGRHKSSQGRYKQSFRGPVRRNNPSFAALDTTPTSRTTVDDSGLSADTCDPSLSEPRHGAPATPENTDSFELIHPPNDVQMYDEDGLADLDMLAVEAQTSSHKPSRAKSFTWSDTGSISRRSSPLAAGETPQAPWLLDDVDSLPNPYSSPRSGNSTFPSTMPLPKEQFDSIMVEGPEMAQGFDFSETASTARRSTPLDLDSHLDDAWEFGDSNPATPNATSLHEKCTSSSLSSMLSENPTPQRCKNSIKDGISQKANELSSSPHDGDGHYVGVHRSAPDSREQQTASKGTGQRRRQRPKPPIKIDDSTQRDDSDPLRQADPLSSTANPAPPSKTQKFKPKKGAKKKTASAKDTTNSKVPGTKKDLPRGSTQNTATVSQVRRAKKVSPAKDMESSWEPSQNKHARPRKSVAASATPVASKSVQQRHEVISGPAANTRARDKKQECRSVHSAGVNGVGTRPDVVAPEKADSTVDPPSGQSATSGVADLSSPTWVEESTYFVPSGQVEDNEPCEGSLEHGMNCTTCAGDEVKDVLDDHGAVICLQPAAITVAEGALSNEDAAVSCADKTLTGTKPPSPQDALSCPPEDNKPGSRASQTASVSREARVKARSNQESHLAKEPQQQLPDGHLPQQREKAVHAVERRDTAIELSSDSDADSNEIQDPDHLPHSSTKISQTDLSESKRSARKDGMVSSHMEVPDLEVLGTTKSKLGIRREVGYLSHDANYAVEPQQKGPITKVHNTPVHLPDLGQKRHKRVFSVRNAGSPVMENSPPKRRKKNRKDLDHPNKFVYDDPLQLVYAGHDPAESRHLVSTSSQESTELVAHRAGGIHHAGDRRRVAHLEFEAADLLKVYHHSSLIFHC